MMGHACKANHRRRARHHVRGLTLVEALVASTLLAVVAASATLPFASGMQHVNEAARLELAGFLGQAMMEEILARPFFTPDDRTPSPGPDAGKTRDLFDNIDDFHGYAETPGDLRNYKNQPFTVEGAKDFWRDVSVEYISFPKQSAGEVHVFVRIRVRVFSGTEKLLELTRIASRED